MATASLMVQTLKAAMSARLLLVLKMPNSSQSFQGQVMGLTSTQSSRQESLLPFSSLPLAQRPWRLRNVLFCSQSFAEMEQTGMHAI